MKRSHLQLFVSFCLLMTWLVPHHGRAQTKFYALGGLSNIDYHNKAYPDEPALRNFYYGVEVDRYLDYHYALTSGAFFLQGGYDNGVSRWTNQFIQVPIGIKAASLGDVLGISTGINLNYLVNLQAPGTRGHAQPLLYRQCNFCYEKNTTGFLFRDCHPVQSNYPTNEICLCSY